MFLLLLFVASLWAGMQNAFAGGGAFVLLPTLMLTGMDARAAKNVLIGAINASAVAIFLFSPQVRWGPACIAAAGALMGGITGALLLQRVNELWLRIFVISIGTALTIGLFIKAP